LAVLGVIVLAYFVCYPQDLAALLAPLERLLAVSNAISLGLYAVIAVAILAWTALRIWDRRSGSKAGRETPPG
jgi:hypothetical protein